MKFGESHPRFSYFSRFKQDQIKVKVGEYNFNEAGDTLDSTYALASMKYHENYNTKTFENDIAILKLERPVTFSKSVYPICLPPSGETFANKRAFVIGKLLDKKNYPWASFNGDC